MRAALFATIALSTLAVALPQQPTTDTTTDTTDSTAPASSDAPTVAPEVPSSASADPTVALDQLAALSAFAAQAVNDTLTSTSKKRGTCTLANLRVRKNWTLLSSAEKKSYIKAALCLQKKSQRTPASAAPGVRSRFDDFVATHINQSFTIHYTGTFLPWHRLFLYEYEKALRDECGYTGYQPYWNWAESAVTGLANHPMFDGSATSMSGNGAPIANQGPIVVAVPGFGQLSFPAGTGGGCVTGGPFKNMSVNLGPGGLVVPSPGVAPNSPTPLNYNPRCLKRDLSDYVNQRYANASSIVHLILNNAHTEAFQAELEGPPGVDLGVHGGGHFSMGGDPGRDFMVSPSDPAFYFHHAMVDRVWWIWQSLDPVHRYVETSGTEAMLNLWPAPNVTLATTVDIGYAGVDAPMKVGDVMSTTDGPFCYVYL